MRWARRNARIGIAVAAALAWTAPGSAQTSRDYDWCLRKRGASDDQVITGCTAVIESRRETRENRAISYNNRGLAYFHKGTYDRAIEDFDEAIRLDPPHSARPLSNRGNVYRKQGDYDHAIAYYDEAIRLNPAHADYYFNRGISY